MAKKISEILMTEANEEITNRLGKARQHLGAHELEAAIKELLAIVGAQQHIIKHFWAVLGEDVPES
jgi:hypothetical protein